MTQSLYIAQDPNPIIILDFSFPLTSNPSANPINFMNIYPHTYIHHTFIHTYTYTYIYMYVSVYVCILNVSTSHFFIAFLLVQITIALNLNY